MPSKSLRVFAGHLTQVIRTALQPFFLHPSVADFVLESVCGTNGERFARRKQAKAFAPGRDLRPFRRKGESVNPRETLGFEQPSDCLFAVCNHDNDSF